MGEQHGLPLCISPLEANIAAPDASSEEAACPLHLRHAVPEDPRHCRMSSERRLRWWKHMRPFTMEVPSEGRLDLKGVPQRQRTDDTMAANFSDGPLVDNLDT